ncbi:MAG: hypothetical protein HC793_04680 [Aquincola sp.]|nr:hypothetical protein [Aquincola sp.]
MFTIEEIHAREILDSRGNPTLEVECLLEGGAFGQASIFRSRVSLVVHPPDQPPPDSHQALMRNVGDGVRFQRVRQRRQASGISDNTSMRARTSSLRLVSCVERVSIEIEES